MNLPLWTQVKQISNAITESRIASFWRESGKFAWAIPFAVADIALSENRVSAVGANAADIAVALALRKQRGWLPFVAPPVAYALTRPIISYAMGYGETEATEGATITQRVASHVIARNVEIDESANRISGKDDDYNTIPGLSDIGIAGQLRKANTDFGSGYQGQDNWSFAKFLSYLNSGLVIGAAALTGYDRFRFPGAIGGAAIGAGIVFGTEALKPDMTGEKRLWKTLWSGALEGFKLSAFGSMMASSFMKGATLEKKFGQKILGKMGKMRSAETLTADEVLAKAGQDFGLSAKEAIAGGLYGTMGRGFRKAIEEVVPGKAGKFIGLGLETQFGSPTMFDLMAEYGTIQKVPAKAYLLGNLKDVFLGTAAGVAASLPFSLITYPFTRNKAANPIKGHDAGHWGREQTFASGDFEPGASKKNIFRRILETAVGGTRKWIRDIGMGARLAVWQAPLNLARTPGYQSLMRIPATALERSRYFTPHIEEALTAEAKRAAFISKESPKLGQFQKEMDVYGVTTIEDLYRAVPEMSPKDAVSYFEHLSRGGGVTIPTASGAHIPFAPSEQLLRTSPHTAGYFLTEKGTKEILEHARSLTFHEHIERFLDIMWPMKMGTKSWKYPLYLYSAEHESIGVHFAEGAFRAARGVDLRTTLIQGMPSKGGMAALPETKRGWEAGNEFHVLSKEFGTPPFPLGRPPSNVAGNTVPGISKGVYARKSRGIIGAPWSSPWAGLAAGLRAFGRGVARIPGIIGRLGRVGGVALKELVGGTFSFLRRDVLPGILHGRPPEMIYLAANLGQIGLASAGVPYSAASWLGVSLGSKALYLTQKAYGAVKPYLTAMREFREAFGLTRRRALKYAMKGVRRVLSASVRQLGDYIMTGRLNKAGLFVELGGGKLGREALKTDFFLDANRKTAQLGGFDNAYNTIQGLTEGAGAKAMRESLDIPHGSGWRGLLKVLGHPVKAFRAWQFRRVLGRGAKLYQETIRSALTGTKYAGAEVKVGVEYEDILQREGSIWAIAKAGEERAVSIYREFSPQQIYLGRIEIAENIRGFGIGGALRRGEADIFKRIGFSPSTVVKADVVNPKTARLHNLLYGGTLTPYEAQIGLEKELYKLGKIPEVLAENPEKFRMAVLDKFYTEETYIGALGEGRLGYLEEQAAKKKILRNKLQEAAQPLPFTVKTKNSDGVGRRTRRI